MILWFMLGVSTLIAFTTLALVSANAAARRDINAALRRHGVKGTPIGCTAILAGYALVALWVVYAVQVGDWRIGAVPLLPFVAGLISGIAGRDSKKTEPVPPSVAGYPIGTRHPAGQSIQRTVQVQRPGTGAS